MESSTRWSRWSEWLCVVFSLTNVRTRERGLTRANSAAERSFRNRSSLPTRPLTTTCLACSLPPQVLHSYYLLTLHMYCPSHLRSFAPRFKTVKNLNKSSWESFRWGRVWASDGTEEAERVRVQVLRKTIRLRFESLRPHETPHRGTTLQVPILPENLHQSRKYAGTITAPPVL